ncbi:MAG: radical SAM family heme chaperone HemW [Gammaproteobacteria bacterium]|nr:radical SAM family heme chaperone HemW [Gammaproteobacteria bacterium]
MLQLPTISLYIHYPWCVKKCPYCDFNSHEGVPDGAYVEALLVDLKQDLPYLQGRSIHSIFIGGGTPSLLGGDELERLMQGLYQNLSIDKDAEITLETNPGTFEIDKFVRFRGAGINRLSIGVQSFNDQHLRQLGRIHSSDEATQAIVKAKAVGFDNFNIDLMHGLEGQTLKQCLSDVERALSFDSTHISFYQLTLEPNTLFAKFPPKLPDDEDIWAMGAKGSALIESHGHQQYEISAYGQIPSKHNMNYWQFGDYLGIGAGAHGKITDSNTQTIFRTLKPKSPKEYMTKHQGSDLDLPVKIIENPTFEFMLNALRLKQGFDLALFESRTGNSCDMLSEKLQSACDLGLLSVESNWVKPTAKGFNFVNDLQEMFL